MIKNKNHMFYKRKEQNRVPERKVLIVTEGEKTEINYFKGMIDDLNIGWVELKHEEPTPDRVAETALRMYEKEERKGSKYTAVYCVMDRDNHQSFKKTLEKIKRNQAKGMTIYAVVSVPSFEYWFLLHFQYSTKPYETIGKVSAGDDVKHDLNELMGKKLGCEYSKTDNEIYTKLKPYLLKAEKNAKLVEEHDKIAESFNPYTNVYQLTQCFRDKFENKIKVVVPDIEAICKKK